MSIFFRRPEARSMDWWGAGYHTPPTNRVINAETATYLGPVFAAIRHIVDFGSTLPLEFHRKNADGTTTEVATPQLFANQDGEGRAGVGSWIGQALFSMITDGNAVGFITATDGFGFPTDVAWLKRADWNYNVGTKQWLFAGEVIPSSKVVHIPWIVPSGHKLGLSPIEHYRQMIQAGLSAQEYADLKRGGGIPPTVLKNTAITLTAEQADIMKRRAVASFAKGDPFVTGSDWDFSTVTIPPNQAMFLETIKVTANQVAAIYGLEPREVGGQVDTGGDTLRYVNDESLPLNRAGNVRPYLQRLEDAFTRMLPARVQAKFDIGATIRIDTQTRFNIYQQELAMGTRSVNEIRELEDRPPVKGGDYFNVPSAARPPEPAAPEPTPQGARP